MVTGPGVTPGGTPAARDPRWGTGPAARW